MPPADPQHPRLFTDDGRPATDVCAKCGYALIGLPIAGNCPECGQETDAEVVLIYGHGVGAHERIGNASRGRVGWLVAWGGLIFLPQIFNGRHTGWTWVAGLLVFHAFFQAIQFFARGESRHPGLAQVRMNLHGCVQHDDLTGPSTLKSLMPYLVPLMIVGLSVAFAVHSGTLVWFWIAMGGVGAFAIAHLLDVWLRKPLPPALLTLADDWQTHPPTPWAKLRHVVIGERKPGIYRIRIRSTESAWKWRSEPVHLEFSATPAEVAMLREYVAARIDRGTTSHLPDNRLQKELRAIAGRVGGESSR